MLIKINHPDGVPDMDSQFTRGYSPAWRQVFHHRATIKSSLRDCFVELFVLILHPYGIIKTAMLYIRNKNERQAFPD